MLITIFKCVGTRLGKYHSKKPPILFTSNNIESPANGEYTVHRNYQQKVYISQSQ